MNGFLDIPIEDATLGAIFDEAEGTVVTPPDDNGGNPPADKPNNNPPADNPPNGDGSNPPANNEPDANKMGSKKHAQTMAKAFFESGMLATMSQEDVDKVESIDDLVDLMTQDRESAINNGINERVKRYNDAINGGVSQEPLAIITRSINTLDNISDEQLTAETPEAENLRKNIIFQNYLNKGLSKEEAADLATRSVENGNDIKDAQTAFTSCKKYYKDAYDKLVNDAETARKTAEEESTKRSNNIKTAILEGKDGIFGALDLGKQMRQKIYDTLTAQTVKTKDGRSMSEFENYIATNKDEFYQMSAAMYVLTDGFKNLDKLISGTVKKAVQKQSDNLKRVLNTTVVDSNGSLDYRAGVSADDDDFNLSEWSIVDPSKLPQQ